MRCIRYVGLSLRCIRYVGLSLRCIRYVGLSSAIIGFLHNSIHPPEMEVNPPKTECGCPCDNIIKTKLKYDHTGIPLTLWNAPVNGQLYVAADPLALSAGAGYNS